MKFNAFFSLILVLFISGCANNDETCDLDITPLLNDREIPSAWLCTGDLVGTFSFGIYEDGHGTSSSIGSFTWYQNCNEIEIMGAVPQTIKNIEMDFGGESGSFTTVQEGGKDTVYCTLK